MTEAFQITERRCKICMSAERQQLDAMLLGENYNDDGQQYSYAEIIEFAADEGLEISMSGLSRHYSNHVQPSMRAYLEAQDAIEAVNKATGKKLSLHSAFANIVTAKILRVLDGLDNTDLAALDIEKLLRVGLMAGRNSLHIEKTEALLKPTEVAENVGRSLEGKGITQETIARIQSEILGMA